MALASVARGVEIRHLRAFVAVSEELHFTRAAERLFLAQQALSGQIRQLERLVGETLFTRTTRRVQLTTAGEALLAYAPAVLALADEAVGRARAAATDGRRSVRVAYTPSVRLIGALMEALDDQQEELSVLAEEVGRVDATAMLRRGECDIALLRVAPTDPDLCAVRVQTEPFTVTLAETHPLACRSVIHAEELHDCVLAFWPREHWGLFGEVTDAFAPNIEAGRVYEYSNCSRDGFLGDVGARREILAGRAFGLSLPSSPEQALHGAVVRELQPVISADIYAVQRGDGHVAPVSARARATVIEMLGALRLAADAVPV